MPPVLEASRRRSGRFRGPEGRFWRFLPVVVEEIAIGAYAPLEAVFGRFCDGSMSLDQFISSC